MMNLRDLIRHAERQGFTVKRGGNHLKWYSPQGHLVGVSPDPTGGSRNHVADRSQKNLIAQLRRAGLEL